MLIEDIQREKDSIDSIVKVLVMIGKGKGITHALHNLADGNVLYHDTYRGKSVTKSMGMLPITKRSRPTNTPLYIHNEYDDKLNEQHGHPFRSHALFTYLGTLDQQSRKEERIIVLPSDNAQLLYSQSSTAPHDFFVRFLNKNRELLSGLSEALRKEGVNKFHTGEIEAVMDMTQSNALGDIKAQNLSNVYAFALRNYPDEAAIILKHYIRKVDRFLTQDAKRTTVTGTASIFDEISKKPEIMVADSEVLYLSTDSFLYHIEGEVDTFRSKLKEALNAA